jgi:hypothetical protein
MKRWLALSLAVMTVAGTGCIVVHTEKDERPRPRSSRATRPLEEARPQDITIAEIDAVRKLSFDNDRQSAYGRIAERENLSDEAQVYLVEAVFKNLSFEKAKVDVLLTLVNNRTFSQAAKGAILDRLDGLSFEKDKSQILEAMAKR